MDFDQVKEVGIRAAERAGEVLRSFRQGPLRVRKKGAIDLVTDADMASEKVILETIRSTFPDHDILAEESGGGAGPGACRWVIDPLDGTTNYAHGLDQYAVSIAFALDGEVVVGVVLLPAGGGLFAAVRGQGTTLNDRAIRVSTEASLTDSLLVTGFPYDLKERMDSLIPRFSSCLLASQGVRRTGSAALDLCYVACGRFEGFWEENLKPWDTAAGVLIVEESGGRVSDFSGRPFQMDMKEILATNGLIHNELMARLGGVQGPNHSAATGRGKQPPHILA
jgi:myo-inositol-1(or 4)-monophosphatase